MRHAVQVCESRVCGAVPLSTPGKDLLPDPHTKSSSHQLRFTGISLAAILALRSLLERNESYLGRGASESCSPDCGRSGLAITGNGSTLTKVCRLDSPRSQITTSRGRHRWPSLRGKLKMSQHNLGFPLHPIAIDSSKGRSVCAVKCSGSGLPKCSSRHRARFWPLRDEIKGCSGTAHASEGVGPQPANAATGSRLHDLFERRAVANEER